MQTGKRKRERGEEEGGWNQTFRADDGQGGIVMGRDGGVAVWNDAEEEAGPK